MTSVAHDHAWQGWVGVTQPGLAYAGHCSHCTQGLHTESRHGGGSGHILVQNFVTSPVRYSDSYHSHIPENGSQIVPCKCLNWQPWVLKWFLGASLWPNFPSASLPSRALLSKDEWALIISKFWSRVIKYSSVWWEKSVRWMLQVGIKILSLKSHLGT